MLLFARTPVDGSYWVDVLPSMMLVGAGAGVAFPALMGLAMSGAAPEDAGLASGLVNTSAQVGGAVGLAVLATLATERTGALTAAGEAMPAALNAGFHLAYLVGAAAMAAAIAIAVGVIRVERPEPAAKRERVRARAAYSEA